MMGQSKKEAILLLALFAGPAVLAVVAIAMYQGFAVLVNSN